MGLISTRLIAKNQNKSFPSRRPSTQNSTLLKRVWKRKIT